LPLNFKGREMDLPLKIYPYGYTYRVEVMVDEVMVIFEPDEEGSYRAIGVPGQVEPGLLGAIADLLEKLR